MPTLRQFEYLVTIVDEGSFTRAAERLHITQPGLSHQFQALEREIGGPLLERLPRAVRPTPAGRAMLPHARAALAEARRATTAARRAAGLATGELHLATLYSISHGLLPAALGTWRRHHPGVRVRLFEHRRTEELTAAMTAGEADIAVGPPPPGWEGPVRHLGTEEFLVVTRTDDPAARNTRAPRIDLAGLAEREWVHYTPDSGLADVLDRACATAGFRPEAAVRTEQAPAAAKYAATGLGPTLVPANAIPPHFNGAVLRPDPPVSRPLTAYTRTTPDPVSAAFLDILADQDLLTPRHIRRRLRPATSG
ncbi:LysR family transcriptional regulator [Kitasatospora sp. NPDC001159]